MLIAYCFVVILAGLISILALWPWLSLLSLLAAPLVSSALCLGFAASVTWRYRFAARVVSPSSARAASLSLG